MIFTASIRTQDLAFHYDAKSWVLLDCRTDLTQPDWGYQNFLAGHIPGSIYADLNRDLSAPVTLQTGRHPLPDPTTFIHTLQTWGIEPGVQVVAIDTANGTFAARIWWMCRAVGHHQVAVLDGGYAKWVKENRPIVTHLTNPRSTSFQYSPGFQGQSQKSAEDIVKSLHDKSILLLDARAPERYRGEIEPIDAIAGRIPGALNRPTSSNLLPDGTLKPAEILREEFLALIQTTPPKNVVAYCGSGVTSCHLILAMEVAGLSGAALYPGSWSEWIRDPNHPVERG